MLCQWDPHSIPILSEVGGKVRFEDVIEGETMRLEKDPSGHVRMLVMEHKGDLHPQIVLEDDSGKILDFYYLPEKAHIEVQEGKVVSAGTLLAKTPREVSGTQDITGGLPRVTEIFEARKPKDPAVIAEIDGTVEILGEKRRGKRTIVVRSESGIEREHLVSHGKHLRVHTGSFVRAGESLVDGPLVPHDILRISGEEAVQQYLVREIQNVYRSQRVEINDKHIEIIVSQMLRKLRVESVGDTGLLPGSVMDKFEFRAVNQELAKCVKITEKGDSNFEAGALVPIAEFEQANTQIEAIGGELAKAVKPKMATASTQLLGITKAAVQSSSFISAASFQETTKVLTEAALAGKIDNLVGLKENVILGHLIPAGTGFRTYQEGEVRIRPQALEGLIPEKEDVLARHFPLLDGGERKAPKRKKASWTPSLSLPPSKSSATTSNNQPNRPSARGVSIQKLDPYLNVDPGTMSPYQHGEVFVTSDGAETDLDLGHYERFIDEELTKASSVTTGQIYQSVIAKERKGEFLGGTIQAIPHVTNENQSTRPPDWPRDRGAGSDRRGRRHGR